jgi:diadenylate cyclase
VPRALKWILSLVFQNFGWKLLSLLAAVILWALVASEPELSTYATVQVQYKNLPDDLELSSEPLTQVMLELRGPSGELRGFGETGLRPAVVLEMSGVLPGERTFAISSDNVKLSRGVRLVRAMPAEVRFTFEKRAVRRVPVTVRVNGDGSAGYVVASKSVDPPELTVVGPASHVARIQTAYTDPVDVSSVVASSEFRTNAYVTDPFVRFQSSPQVAVTVTMRKR